MKAILLPPLQISPLIKLTRWIFLISGIYYGIVKHKEYSIAAAKFREEEKRMKILRHEQFVREEALRNQETAKSIAEALTGLRIRFEEVFDIEKNDLTSEEKTQNNDSTSNDDPIPTKETNDD